MLTFPPKRILVAVDFGDASSHAVRLAGALAERFGAPLAGLHAESLEAPPYFTHDQVEALERQQQEARKRAAQFLSRTTATLTRVPVEPLITSAPVAEAILDAAATADLVVMGTHGRRGPSRWWLGSVAERVVRSAPVPVLVVHADQTEHAPATHFERMLVVAGDGGAAADRYVADLARAFGGRPVERLTECSEEAAAARHASLVAIGVPGASGGRLPEVAERLIRGCRLPMLFVPEK